MQKIAENSAKVARTLRVLVRLCSLFKKVTENILKSEIKKFPILVYGEIFEGDL